MTSPTIERVLNGMDGSRRVAWAKFFALAEDAVRAAVALRHVVECLHDQSYQEADRALSVAFDVLLAAPIPDRTWNLFFGEYEWALNQLLADLPPLEPRWWAARLAKAEQQQRESMEDPTRLADILQELRPEPSQEAVDRVIAVCDEWDTPEQIWARRIAYARHYPDDFQRAMPGLYSETLARMEATP